MKLQLPKTKFINLLIVALVFSLSVQGQQFVPAAKGSKAVFKIASHREGEEVIKGMFTGFKGSITFDPNNLATAAFDITVSVSSINTGLAERNNVLKKLPFFNLAKYPLIHIKSVNVTQDMPGSAVYTLHGNLTVNGITNPVNLQFMATPNEGAYLFRGSLELSRKAFNVGNSSELIEDHVSVFIEVRTTRK